MERWLKRNWRLLAAVAVALALIGIFVSRSHGQDKFSTAVCTESYRRDDIIKVGQQTLDAQEAKTPAQRTQGLSGKACIEQNQAMLFIFQTPGYYSFWMKDMKFPIDIVWVSADHKTVDVIRNVQPSTYPYSFANKGQQALYVIELAAGRSKSLGITPGAVINF